MMKSGSFQTRLTNKDTFVGWNPTIIPTIPLDKLIVFTNPLCLLYVFQRIKYIFVLLFRFKCTLF